MVNAITLALLSATDQELSNSFIRYDIESDERTNPVQQLATWFSEMFKPSDANSGQSTDEETPQSFPTFPDLSTFESFVEKLCHGFGVSPVTAQAAPSDTNNPNGVNLTLFVPGTEMPDSAKPFRSTSILEEAQNLTHRLSQSLASLVPGFSEVVSTELYQDPSGNQGVRIIYNLDTANLSQILPSLNVGETKPVNQSAIYLPGCDRAPLQQTASTLPSYDPRPLQQTANTLPSYDPRPLQQTANTLPSFDSRPLNQYASTLPSYTSRPLNQYASTLPSYTSRPLQQTASTLPSFDPRPLQQTASTLPANDERAALISLHEQIDVLHRQIEMLLCQNNANTGNSQNSYAAVQPVQRMALQPHTDPRPASLQYTRCNGNFCTRNMTEVSNAVNSQFAPITVRATSDANSRKNSRKEAMPYLPMPTHTGTTPRDAQFSNISERNQSVEPAQRQTKGVVRPRGTT